MSSANIRCLREPRRSPAALISPLDAERLRFVHPAARGRAHGRRATNFAAGHSASSVPNASVVFCAGHRSIERAKRAATNAADRRVALHHRQLRVRFQQNAALHRQQTEASLRRAVRDLRDHRRHEKEKPRFSLLCTATCQAVGRCAGHRREPETNRFCPRLAQARRRRARRDRQGFAHEILRFLRHVDRR